MRCERNMLTVYWSNCHKYSNDIRQAGGAAAPSLEAGPMRSRGKIVCILDKYKGLPTRSEVQYAQYRVEHFEFV